MRIRFKAFLNILLYLFSPEVSDSYNHTNQTPGVLADKLKFIIWFIISILSCLMLGNIH